MINNEGLVIAARDVGESGRFITLLTREYGCIELYVRGGKKSKKSISSTQLFCYAKYSFEEKKDAYGNSRYYYNSSEPIRLFYNIRLDPVKTALGCYFTELIKFTSGSCENLDDIMRLTLNTLHFLDKGGRDVALLKSIFELRLLSDSGFRPALVGCHVCMKATDEKMMFNIRSGELKCTEHFPALPDEYDYVLDEKLLYIVRYIILVDYDRLWNFRISERCQKQLTSLAEAFAEYHCGKVFETLKFYKCLSE